MHRILMDYVFSMEPDLAARLAAKMIRYHFSMPTKERTVSFARNLLRESSGYPLLELPVYLLSLNKDNTKEIRQAIGGSKPLPGAATDDNQAEANAKYAIEHKQEIAEHCMQIIASICAEDSFLTFNDIMEIAHCSKGTVRNIISKNNLPIYKPSNTPLVKKRDFMMFLESCRVGKKNPTSQDTAQKKQNSTDIAPSTDKTGKKSSGANETKANDKAARPPAEKKPPFQTAHGTSASHPDSRTVPKQQEERKKEDVPKPPMPAEKQDNSRKSQAESLYPLTEKKSLLFPNAGNGKKDLHSADDAPAASKEDMYNPPVKQPPVPAEASESSGNALPDESWLDSLPKKLINRTGSSSSGNSFL